MVNVTAANATIKDCEIILATTSKEAVIGILADASADRMTVEKCHMHDIGVGGCDHAISFGADDHTVIRDNIITGLFWHAHPARTRDARLLAFAMDGIIRSDRLFTMPGVIAIIAAGVALAVVGKFPLLGTGWILWSIVLFGVSGALFGMRFVPLQRALRALAEAGARTGEFDFAAYMALARRWDLWGGLALAAPLAALATLHNILSYPLRGLLTVLQNKAQTASK